MQRMWQLKNTIKAGSFYIGNFIQRDLFSICQYQETLIEVNPF